MASRYGRNKRRQHREQIARLEQEVVRYARTAKKVFEFEHKLQMMERMVRDWNEDTAQLLGEFSAFLSKPGQIKVNRFIGRMHPHKQPEIYCMDPNEAILESTMAIRIEALHMFRTMCSADLDKLSTLIRLVQVNAATEERVYCVSQTLSDMMPSLAKLDREYLAIDIAQKMMEYWKQARR